MIDPLHFRPQRQQYLPARIASAYRSSFSSSLIRFSSSAATMAPDLPIIDALRQFRRGRTHLALVREGNGPILGLCTLEDVLEEIVGQIEDEHDEPTPAGSE